MNGGPSHIVAGRAPKRVACPYHAPAEPLRRPPVAGRIKSQVLTSAQPHWLALTLGLVPSARPPRCSLWPRLTYVRSISASLAFWPPAGFGPWEAPAGDQRERAEQGRGVCS